MARLSDRFNETRTNGQPGLRHIVSRPIPLRGGMALRKLGFFASSASVSVACIASRSKVAARQGIRTRSASWAARRAVWSASGAVWCADHSLVAGRGGCQIGAAPPIAPHRASNSGGDVEEEGRRFGERASTSLRNPARSAFASQNSCFLRPFRQVRTRPPQPRGRVRRGGTHPCQPVRARRR